MTLDPPVAMLPSPGHRLDFRGEGICYGSLDGGPSLPHPVAVQIVDTDGFLGCAVAHSLEGAGTFTFTGGTADPDDDRSIAFTFDQVSALSETPFLIRGAQGGLLVGEGSFLGTASQDGLQHCLDGEVRRQHFAATSKTITPLVG